MGVGNLSLIAQSIIDAGLSPSTPDAAIDNGRTKNQQRVLSQLDQLHDAVATSSLKAPVMIIIGKVVALAEELDWFQHTLEETTYAKNAVAHS